MNRPDTVRELFEQAAELSAGARDAFLSEACGGDAALRAEVEELLMALDDAGGFLEPPAAEEAAGARSGASSGTRIGRYTLLEQIGEGGMGTVWMAEQHEPVRRKVALKLIKLGLDTRQVVARFEAERQALALMDHPGIAKVLDGGSTESGRPYFVMELVRGAPITKYCDEARLSTAGRLALFQQVCHAVQHAHQKGVVHRDIKPSNVLVTLHDGTPVPVVIDFGVAKAVDSELTQRTLFTEFRQMVGTPEYMAPEQAALSGIDVDTRADVYSLGVLLYELLTGTTPFDSRDLLRAGYEGLLRHIREVDPPKPSTRISTLGDDLPLVARSRQTVPGQLGRLVRGELDWIAMKALEKDRTRRYETPSAFAADLARYLLDEPVEAGPPGARYRLRKLVRRNRAAFGTAALVFAALSIGLAAAWRALAHERVAQAAARVETERAELEVAKFRAVNDFLQHDLLGAVDPDRAQGEDVRLLDVLDSAARALGEGAANESPAVEAEIRSTVGWLYYRIGAGEKGEPHLRRALELRREMSGDDAEKALAEDLSRLGTLLQMKGDFETSEELLLESLELRRRLYPTGHRQLVVGLNDLGGFCKYTHQPERSKEYFQLAFEQSEADETSGACTLGAVRGLAIAAKDLGDPVEAERLLRFSLARSIEHHGADHTAVTGSRTHLGRLLLDQGRFDEAEEQFRANLETKQRLYAGPHISTSWTRSDLGTLHFKRGDYALAEEIMREVLEERRELLPDGHHDLADALGNLGAVLRRRGKIDEAHDLSVEDLRMTRAAWGDDALSCATKLNNLGVSHQARGEVPAAEACFREALAIRRNHLGETHPHVGQSLVNLGNALASQARFDEALDVTRQGLRIRRDYYGNDHAEVASGVYNLGRVLYTSGRAAESAAAFRESVAIAERVFGADSPQLGSYYYGLVRPLMDLKEYEEASAVNARAMERCRELYGDVHPTLADLLGNEARIAEAQGRLDEAVTGLQESLEMARRVSRGSHPRVAGALDALARIHVARVQFAEAEPLLREALAIRVELQPDHWIVVETKSRLGRALSRQAKFEEAEPLLLEAVEMQVPPGMEPHVEGALAWTVELYEQWHEADSTAGKDEQAARWRRVKDERFPPDE